MKRTYPCLSIVVALVLGTSLPICAYADAPSDLRSEQLPASPSRQGGANVFSPSDFGSDYVAPTIDRVVSDEGEIAPIAVSGEREFVQLSDEMKYFLKYESSQDYDAGLSYYDGYHALGYYQWDNTANLQPFITYCYNYDPETFSMFAPYITGAGLNLASSSTWEAEKWNVDAAWHEAYKAAPDVFAGLQDTYNYETCYLPAERDLKSRGIDISGRADCIKGLCWGVANLFGLSGWHRFVGGTIYVYDENHNTVAKEMPGCGLDNGMTDAQFAKALCTFISENVADFYPSQPQYHEGWSNRYKSELKGCCRYLGVNADDIDDLIQAKWYYPTMKQAIAEGLIEGYGDKKNTYGPDDLVTRGQTVTIFWRMLGKPRPSNSTSNFTDVSPRAYYGEPVAWANEYGVVNGSSKDNNATFQFRPDDAVTREEVAKILANYAELIGENVEGVNKNVLYSGAFRDASDVSSFAIAPLAWAVQNKIITGKSDVYLAPQTNCTRAELVTMLMRFRSNVLAKR